VVYSCEFFFRKGKIPQTFTHEPKAAGPTAGGQAAVEIFAVSWTPRAFITVSVVFSVGFPLALKER
jgi:hypothetical protein